MRTVHVTGNEDGVKHCAMNVLYSLQHLGYLIPPQADAGWIGEAGPDPSYLDPGPGGPENDFTNRNTTFMTWNSLHLARMLRDRGGIPVHGNQRSEWTPAAGSTSKIPNTADFGVDTQVLHRFGVDAQCMTNRNRMDTLVRTVAAVATSVITGATAGALLARRPLVVRVGSDGRRHVGTLR